MGKGGLDQTTMTFTGLLPQVGWRRSGLGLWSVSGCRLLCSLRQTPRTPRSAQAVMGLPRPRTPNVLQAPSLEVSL